MYASHYGEKFLDVPANKIYGKYITQGNWSVQSAAGMCMHHKQSDISGWSDEFKLYYVLDFYYDETAGRMKIKNNRKRS